MFLSYRQKQEKKGQYRVSNQDPNCKQSELTINSSKGDLLEILDFFFTLSSGQVCSSPLFILTSHLSIPQGLTSAQFALTFLPVNSQTAGWLTDCPTDSKWNGMRQGAGAQRDWSEEVRRLHSETQVEFLKNQKCNELARNLWEITVWNKKSYNWISLTQHIGSKFKCW